MKAYRCCSSNEICHYLNKEKCSLSGCVGTNTFNYDKDTDYIHFFYFPENCAYYTKRRSYRVSNIIICDVPDELLKKYLGYGYYDGICGGRYIPFPEFAIPLDEFSIDYIKRIIEPNSIQREFNESRFQEYLEMIPEEYTANWETGSFKEGYTKDSVVEMPDDYIFGKRNLDIKPYIKKTNEREHFIH